RLKAAERSAAFLRPSLRRPDLGSPELFNLERSRRPVNPPVVMHHGIAPVVVSDAHAATHDLFFVAGAPVHRSVVRGRSGQAVTRREERMEGANEPIGDGGELLVHTPFEDRRWRL